MSLLTSLRALLVLPSLSTSVVRWAVGGIIAVFTGMLVTYHVVTVSSARNEGRLVAEASCIAQRADDLRLANEIALAREVQLSKQYAEEIDRHRTATRELAKDNIALEHEIMSLIDKDAEAWTPDMAGAMAR